MTYEGIRFKIVSKDGGVTLFNPKEGVAMALLTGKLIGLDVMKGTVHQSLFTQTCELTCEGHMFTIPMGAKIEMVGTPSADQMATMSNDPLPATPLSLDHLYKEIDRRVEKIRSYIEKGTTVTPTKEEYAIGTFQDVMLDTQRWL